MKEPDHDVVLIAGIREGNRNLFDYLFLYYYSGLVAYAIKYVSEREAAEDIVQDFFVTLWQKRSSFNINSSIKSYFFFSVKNRCIDYLRRQKVRGEAARVLSLAAKESDEHPERYIVEAELREKISMAINKLPPVCRRVFIQNRFEGLKASEIAEKEGISTRTVEGHIGKALGILRAELKPFVSSAFLVFLLGGL